MTFGDEVERDLERLREAWLDLAYVLGRELGLIWLVRRLGLQPKRWVVEREIRDRHL